MESNNNSIIVTFIFEHPPNQMEKELKELVYFEDFGKSIEHIEDYFITHDGSCG